MRALTVLLSTTALLAASTSAASASHHATQSRADLVAAGVSSSYAAGALSVSARVVNKGTTKAKRSVARVVLSADHALSADDPTVGTIAIGAIKPKKSQHVSETFGVPVSSGTYRVLVCADVDRRVEEANEKNNCHTGGEVTIVPAIASASAAEGGTVAVAGVTGGTCQGTTCTLVPGGGTVTFTATPAPGYVFGSWAGPTCTGGTTAGTAITLAHPASDRACTATFLQQTVTISWEVEGDPFAYLSEVVTGTADHGTCTSAGQTGSCTVLAAVGTVTLSFHSGDGNYARDTWSGATCDGTAANSGTYDMTMTFTAPIADKACVASYVYL